MVRRKPLRRIRQMPRFTVGRDRHGWWVVRDRLDKVGGVFSSEMAALHFAFEESHFDRCDVCCAPRDELIEFDGSLEGLSMPALVRHG